MADSPTILIVAANALSLPQLRLDEEVREITNALRHSPAAYDIKEVWAARPIDLRRALLDHQPTVVHFCGHGAGEAGVVLDDQLATAEALAGLFAHFSHCTECVVLNACHSVSQAHAIAHHIEVVVGMSKEIGDRAAIDFAVGFYDALAAGQTYSSAYSLGCNALQFKAGTGFSTPALVTRDVIIKSGVGSPGTELQPRPHNNSDWGEAPSVSLLYGRDGVAETLRSWIVDDLCRVVLVTGLGGVGKTNLAVCLGRGGNLVAPTSTALRDGIAQHFECVIWRTLFNTPLPQEFFADILAAISRQPHFARAAPPQQIAEILANIQSRRCLMIVDNVEAVLKPSDPAMGFREGYEPFGMFFEQVAKSSHKSCLLMTSREVPRVLADLEGVSRPVRTLGLGGIEGLECARLFASIGSFEGAVEDWHQLALLYNGNPLALELAARHIEKAYCGDIAAFLSEGRPVFAGIQQLLDWHLNRLTPDETELIYWLAIEREPVSLAVLQDDLVFPASRECLPSTVQALQRRVPLERAKRRYFAIQPVLVEHITATIVSKAGECLQIDSPQMQRRVAERFVGMVQDALSADESRLLNRYCLVKATAKEHIRESQRRLILSPILERLMSRRDRKVLESYLMALLDTWRAEPSAQDGYAAGNILHILAHLGIDLAGRDFSHLLIRQACLHETAVRDADFSFCEFRQTTFRQAFGALFSLCHRPDGLAVAVGDDEGNVRLFNSRTGDLLLSCSGHSASVYALVFSPDGEIIASGSTDYTIRLWRASDGACLGVLLGHEGWIYDLSFSPDGECLASASEDGTVRLWRVRGDMIGAIAAREEGFIAAVAISPCGRYLAYGGAAKVLTVRRLDPPGEPVGRAEHGGGIRSVAFAPDGSLMASSGEDAVILLWRSGEAQPFASLKGHHASVRSLSFSPSGEMLASAGGDHGVNLWSVGRLARIGSFYVSSYGVRTASFSPDGKTLATCSTDSTLRIWDSESLVCIVTLRGYSNKTWSVDFVPGSPLLLSGTEDRSLRVWDTASGEVVRELRGHVGRLWAVACSADGRFAASVSADRTARVWSLETGECRWVLHGHTGWIRATAFTSDGGLLATAGEDGTVALWEMDTGLRRLVIQSGISRIFSISARGADDTIVCGGSAPGIHLFSYNNGAPAGEIGGHNGWVRAVVHCSATVIASGSEDGTIKTWDLLGRACCGTIQVGVKVLSMVALGGGREVLAGTEDGRLLVFNLGDGACQASVRAHRGRIWTVAVDEKRKIAASAADDGAILLWTLPDLKPVEPISLLRSPRPYEGMNITGAAGLSPAQRDALLALGAVALPSP